MKESSGERQTSEGILYVVATPIGNLEDITFRAVRTLREVDAIACEDTRTSRVLLKKLDISTELISLHKFSEARKTHAILERLKQGEQVALITDAGTPAISDPGARIVRAALEAGFRVSPVPGPSVIAAALSVAGVEASSFSYHGFAPRKDHERSALFQRILEEGHTAVFLDSPHRLRDTLAVAAKDLTNARIVVLRELTKIHEEILEGSADTILAALESRGPIKGEIAVVLEPPRLTHYAPNMEDIVRMLVAEGLSGKKLADEARRRFGVKKTDAYDAYLRLYCHALNMRGSHRK